MAPWGGFVPPVVSTDPTLTATFNPAPAKKVVPPKQAANKKLDDYVDKDLVEAVIRERNWAELNWLHEVLSVVRIKNLKTGRYLKSDRYLDEIIRIKESGEYAERTTPSGELQEIQSDSFEE